MGRLAAVDPARDRRAMPHRVPSLLLSELPRTIAGAANFSRRTSMRPTAAYHALVGRSRASRRMPCIATHRGGRALLLKLLAVMRYSVARLYAETGFATRRAHFEAITRLR